MKLSAFVLRCRWDWQVCLNPNLTNPKLLPTTFLQHCWHLLEHLSTTDSYIVRPNLSSLTISPTQNKRCSFRCQSVKPVKVGSCSCSFGEPITQNSWPCLSLVLLFLGWETAWELRVPLAFLTFDFRSKHSHLLNAKPLQWWPQDWNTPLDLLLREHLELHQKLRKLAEPH